VAIAVGTVFGANSAANPGSSLAFGAPIAGLHPAGSFGVVGVNINHASVTCTSVTDTQGNTWIKFGERHHATLAIYTALFICVSCIGGANNNCTANFSGAVSADAGIMAGNYTGVLSYNPTPASTEGNSSTALVNFTTQDANNWVAMMMGTLATGTPTAGSGDTLEISDANITLTQALVDSSSASPASLDVSVTNSSSGGWTAIGIELRSVAGWPGRYVPRTARRRSRTQGQTA
jgi:hypothetical protein